MNLSAHFSLHEATRSQTAARNGIDNDPTLDIVQNMKKAALGMELVRLELNQNRIDVSSWFRCLELNRKIGSKDTSAHVLGWAIDFTCVTYGSPDAIVRKLLASKVPFQQIIREYSHSHDTGWVHIAFNGTERKALIIDRDGARPFV